MTRSEFPVVIDRQRRMVTETSFLVYGRCERPGREARRSDLIVDPPSDILGPGLSAVRPPGIGIAGGIGVKPAIDVHPAQLLEHASEPLALLGQESRVLLVRFPVLQIDFPVG